LARQWASQTPDPQVLTDRFLKYIKRDFKYSISAPPVGYNATDEFLFQTKVGFCQHFSSAYAVFMRAAGVPTRVVTGYVGGHYNKLGGYWLLKQKDAHAWDEIWLEDRGWVRVDPTAAIAPENILDTLDDLQARQQAGQSPGIGENVLGSVFDGSDFLRRQWNQLVLGFNAARQQGLLRPLGIEQAEAWQLVTAFGIGSALALALTLWFLLRQHRDLSHPLVRAWREFSRRLGRAEVSSVVLSFSQVYSDWRYAGRVLTDEEQTRLIRGLRGFRMPRRDRS
jgi:hypothetical protein